MNEVLRSSLGLITKVYVSDFTSLSFYSNYAFFLAKILRHIDDFQIVFLFALARDLSLLPSPSPPSLLLSFTLLLFLIHQGLIT